MTKEELIEIRDLFGSSKKLAEAMNNTVSFRTIQGWAHGFPIPKPTELLLLILKETKLNELNNTTD